MSHSKPSRADCTVDIVIVGGGIAGLWLLNQLSGRGYSTVLLEADSLGNGQSIASQGIIHGGLKYALGGSLSGAAHAIAGMPARWRASLAGKDAVDLTGCRLLSEHYFMWSEGSYRSRLKAFLGSRSLRGKVESVPEAEFPPELVPAKGQGSLYRLPDFVVDTGSLLETLANTQQTKLFRIDPSRIDFTGPAGDRRLTVSNGSSSLSIQAQRYVLTAGAGNEKLMEKAGIDSPSMQRRPLNMVMIRKDRLPRLFLHCVGDNFALTPQLTLTSHPCENGETAWYLGGEIAESGTARSDGEQVDHARAMLTSLFPWVNLDDARWACCRIDRAEGSEAGKHRPDTVFLSARNDILVAWPTKFTLSPALADEVCKLLAVQDIVPTPAQSLETLTAVLGKVAVARPPWETCFGNP